MKTTPFTDVHIALGAKMHEFAGFNMPIEYSGIIDEHMTVVNGVGVFDVSHMGEFWVKGPNALAFIQSVTSNDASVLPLGKAQYTCFPNDKGGIVDDLLVYHYEPEKYLLVVNAGNIDKDWDWCVSHNTVGAELENSSDRTAQLAIQGPKAQEVLQRLTPVDLSSIPYYSFVTGEFAGCKNVIISNTGYTGAGGFELYFYPSDGMTIWNAIFEAGKPEGIKPIGLGARDTLRLEMGFCLYGNDLDDTTSPIEAHFQSECITRSQPHRFNTKFFTSFENSCPNCIGSTRIEIEFKTSCTRITCIRDYHIVLACKLSNFKSIIWNR